MTILLKTQKWSKKNYYRQKKMYYYTSTRASKSLEQQEVEIYLRKKK